MSNSYKYIDSNYTYVDPKSGILKNLVDITAADDLLFFESSTVTKRISELHIKPVEIKGIESLFSIHKHLFQDVYDWAGKEKTVEINKDGKQFFSTSNFKNAYRFIDGLILDFRKTESTDTNRIAENLSHILDNINYLHPFRDGNSRAQREFIRMLALEKGIELNLNPPDKKDVYQRYMQGTINSDTIILKELILSLVQ